MTCRSFCLLLAVLITGSGGLVAQARLPDVKISARTACQIHPESGAATAELWIDAKTALEGAEAGDSSIPTYLIQNWRRTLAPDLGLRWERRDTTRVTTRQPFSKKTPANLERAGYIQARWNVLTYYGPGTDLLLSERFLRQHCFRRETGTGSRLGLTGLAFEPLPGQRLPDVAGVLWIDPVLRLLRYLEYTWTNPPLEARAPALGGRIDYTRLADGGWIIQRWNMRMPRASDIPGTGYGGYTDQGGEVLAVGSPRPPRRP
jgi:hypothetical protein